jgi:hypothetical protein
VTSRRLIPWLLLAVLGLLTLGAVALSRIHTSSNSVTPSQLESELTKPTGLGSHWVAQSRPQPQVTKDTWDPSSCYSWSTTFGGPVVGATYGLRGDSGLPFFIEKITVPSEAPNDILDMLASCGRPRGPLPAVLRHGKLTFFRTTPLSSLDGLGDGSFAAISHPRIEGRVQSQVTAYFSLGDELVEVDYLGRTSLASLRVAVAHELTRAARYG